MIVENKNNSSNELLVVAEYQSKQKCDDIAAEDLCMMVPMQKHEHENHEEHSSNETDTINYEYLIYDILLPSLNVEETSNDDNPIPLTSCRDRDDEQQQQQQQQQQSKPEYSDDDDYGALLEVSKIPNEISSSDSFHNNKDREPSSWNNHDDDKSSTQTTTNVSLKMFDVVCGRDSLAYTHPGNKAFRALVEKHREEYQKATFRDDKSRIKFAILQEIQQWTPGGRFLQRDDNNVVVAADDSDGDHPTVVWNVAPEDYALDKISHALRSAKDPSKKKRKRTLRVPSILEQPSSCCTSPQIKRRASCSDESSASSQDSSDTTSDTDDSTLAAAAAAAVEGSFEYYYQNHPTFRNLFDMQQRIFKTLLAGSDDADDDDDKNEEEKEPSHSQSPCCIGSHESSIGAAPQQRRSKRRRRRRVLV